MKTVLFTLALLGFLGGSISQVKAEEKVAIVSLQRALNESEEGKRAKSSLQAERVSKQKELETMKQSLKTMRDNLEKQQAVLSQEAKQQKIAEIQNKFQDFQQKANEYGESLQKKELESTQKIILALRATVIDVAKKQGYDTLYENSSDVILYSKHAVDITSDLIKAYNQKR